MYPKGKPYTRNSYDENGLKICSDCKEHKQLNLYPSNIAVYDKISNICKVCTNKRSRDYVLRNKDKESKRRRLRYLKNKEREIQNDNIYKKKRRETDPKYRLLRNTRERQNRAVKNAGFNKKVKSTLLLGCDSDYLKRYIEIQFKDDMNWSNYGTLWNVDHIFPLSKINWDCIYETAKYCHYSNLQPLYKIENIIKGNKI
jgi:hypothetical protein